MPLFSFRTEDFTYRMSVKTFNVTDLVTIYSIMYKLIMTGNGVMYPSCNHVFGLEPDSEQHQFLY